MIYSVMGVEGVYIEAENYKQLMFGLMQLTKQNADVAEWMEGIARRCAIDSSVDIRTENYEDFVQDLIDHGYLTKQEIH